MGYGVVVGALLQCAAVHASEVALYNFTQQWTAYGNGPFAPLIPVQDGQQIGGFPNQGQIWTTLYDQETTAARQPDYETVGNAADNPLVEPTYLGPASIPPPPTVAPGWTGYGVQFNGNNRYFVADAGGPDLNFVGKSFSALFRFYRTGEGQLPTSTSRIMFGSGSKGNGGWDIFVDQTSGLKGTLNHLDVNLGGTLTGSGPFGVFGGNGPVIQNNAWYDVGLTYDSVLGSLNVYLNGQNIGSFSGTSGFGDTGAVLDVGRDLFLGNGVPMDVAQMQLWNNAISAGQMQALSIPEPSTLVFLLVSVAISGCYLLYQRRSRLRRLHSLAA